MPSQKTLLKVAKKKKTLRQPTMRAEFSLIRARKERKRTNYSLKCVSAVCVLRRWAFVIEFLGSADINSDLLQIIPTFMCLKVTVMMKWKWKKCKYLNDHSSTPSVVISACLTCLSFRYLHFRVTNAGLTEGVTRLQPSSDGKRIFETA